MKTASRILGSAAFHAGFVTQDSPTYGAERRGAPMMAFTRIADTPIRERGAIAQPDLVMVADETLLSDPAALPLVGCGAQCTLVINSTHTAEVLRETEAFHLHAFHQSDVADVGHLLCADFTAMAMDATHTLASLSTALGVAAGCLLGLRINDCVAGLEDELEAAHLTPEQQAANIELARTVYTHVHTWPSVQQRHADAAGAAAPLVEASEVSFAPPHLAAPSIYAVGNSPERRTGNWRQFRPVLDAERCTQCWICFVRCPEAAISLDAHEYPVVDYDTCKGCLLCVHECPTQAFTAEKEQR
jgi:pyruvate ferredoxin oxidoreductase gamma subunit